MEKPPLNTVRVDKWLWAVRLFKTRSIAAEQCSSNKVKRLGNSLKASANIKPGDKLQIPSADGVYKRQIEVLGIYDKRVSAPLAQAAYIDHTPEEIIEQAKAIRAENAINKQHRKEGDQGRMTKKQRRDWNKGLGSSKDKKEE
ncbi:hypothetical protein OAB00_04055 [Akkermansiaceae bacterium]|nr:hypothetical protein [Akkermansiaceae bacterium]